MTEQWTILRGRDGLIAIKTKEIEAVVETDEGCKIITSSDLYCTVVPFAEALATINRGVSESE